MQIYTLSRGFTPVNIHVFKRLCDNLRICLPLHKDISHKSIIRPSSEIVTTCQGMNLGMLPISNVAIPNVQFQLAILETGNFSTLATFSE